MKTPKTISVEQARSFGIANGLTQVIIFGHDGAITHAVTWGDTDEHSAHAAYGANEIKKGWKWPDDTIVESDKVLALQRRIKELEAEIAELKIKNAITLSEIPLTCLS